VLLKRKPERNETISIRVPLSVKSEVSALREIADKRGFDLTASLTDAVLQWIKQVRKELTSTDQEGEALSARKAGGAVLNGGEGHRGNGGLAG